MEATAKKEKDKEAYTCEVKDYLIKVFSNVILKCFFKSEKIDKIGDK